jgi:hypothetical protein
MSDELNLKPCAYCGKEPHAETDDEQRVIVWCTNVCCPGADGYLASPAEWNTRPVEAELLAALEGIVSEIDDCVVDPQDWDFYETAKALIAKHGGNR